MLLVIDNYDSFTYNLVQYLGELGQQSKVVRNDEISVSDIDRLEPSAIVISPGPCTPNEAGISLETVRIFSKRLPILGVCLGHQSIFQAFGGSIVRADKVMHGKVSQIHHDGSSLFRNVENPFKAARYHSLIAKSDQLPNCFKVIAWTEDNIIMGVKHKYHQVYGLQFHPESFVTPAGPTLLENFLYATGIHTNVKAQT